MLIHKLFFILSPVLLASALFSAETPILISSVNDLQRIGNDPAFPIHGAYQLTQDIDASETDQWNGGAGFAPIGSERASFSGSFDGKGYAIEGLVLDRIGKGEWEVGLFGRVGPAGVVSNVRLENARVTGEYRVGGLIGWNTGSVMNCQIVAKVTGDEVGGLVGTNEGKIVGCSASGSVQGNIIGGGLVAINHGSISLSHTAGVVRGGEAGGLVGGNSGEIAKSFSAKVVIGDDLAGGFIGFSDPDDDHPNEIRDCFSVGPVISPRDAGGFAGENRGVILRSYSAGFVRATGFVSGFCRTVRDGTDIDCFWNLETAGIGEDGSGASGRTTTELMAQATFEGWNFADTWTLVENETYPIIDAVLQQADDLIVDIVAENGTVHRDFEASAYSAGSAIWLTAEPDPGFAFAGWTSAAFPEGFLLRENPLPMTISESAQLQAIFLPSGTIEISSIEELAKIGKFPEWPLHWSYALVNDLDASATEGWDDGNGFAPIGAEGVPFSGTFDGQGHVIKDCVIDRPEESMVGLFAQVGPSGKVRNLGLDGGTVVGSWRVGALAGENLGEIVRCFATASVKGRSIVGGLVGKNEGGVSECYAAGAVVGKGTVGGLVGSEYSSVISDSYSAGYVEGWYQVGGLVGRIYQGEVENAYSASRVVSTMSGAGGAFGDGASQNIQSVFFDIETTGQEESAAAMGKTTARMTSQATFEGWDFEEVWEIVEGVTYPTLRSWKDRFDRFPLSVDADHGTVTVAPPQVSYEIGSVAVLDAVPDAGYRFAGWAWRDGFGQEHSSEASLAVAVSGPLVIEALFLPTEPVEVRTLADLAAIGNDPSWPLYGDYVLAADIDASATATWNHGQGFEPIGAGQAFLGSLDGQGFSIRNLTIDRPEEDGVGLFGMLGGTATVRNLGIEGGTISGRANLGALAALNSGFVDNCSATANVSGFESGGLVGENQGTVQNSRASGNIWGGGSGGLVASNEGSISRSSASGEVLGGGGGGLVSRNAGDITDCHATGNVRNHPAVTGASGGLVGENYGRLANCYATGTVHDYLAGGLVGRNESLIRSCYATGGVWGKKQAGGLVASNAGQIFTSFAAGVVMSPRWAGGLLGSHQTGSFFGDHALVVDSYSVGAVRSGQEHRSGILVGSGDGEILRSYALGKILGPFVDAEDEPVIGGGGPSTYLWDTETTGVGTESGGGGRTTSEMMAQETFVGWDFTDVWAIVEGASYPFLRAFAFEENFELTIEADHGTVQTVPAEMSGAPWSLVWMTAEPDPGYVFGGWTGDGFQESAPLRANPLPIVPFQSATVRAVFYPEDGREIRTVTDLARIGRDPEWPLHGSYRLVSDIDASETVTWNRGEGFEPIGLDEPFSGTFDGQGHRILNLTINPIGGVAALFHTVARDGSISNLGIDGGTITTRSEAAGLAWLNEGSIRNCYARIGVTGEAVAGLVFENQGIIEHCYAAGTLTLNDIDSAGGLVAMNYGVIADSYASGRIFAGHEQTHVGGLVGRGGARGEVIACFWDIDGTGVGRSYAGRGLSADDMKTGLIFRNAGWGDGNWRQDEGEDYPRLAWENPALPLIGSPGPVLLAGSGTPTDPFLVQTAADFASLSWHVDLLDKHLRLTRNLDLQDVEIHPIGELGTFTGVFEGSGFAISNGTIDRPGSVMSGLFARIGSGGRVQRLGAKEMRIIGFTKMGVIAAENQGSIIGCSATGEVTQWPAVRVAHAAAGGFVGWNRRGLITRSSADVAVNAAPEAYEIGGFVGNNGLGTIVSSYSRGPVSGGSFWIGGFAGVANGGEISGCYSSGRVSGEAEGDTIGGFIGDPDFAETSGLANFWDRESSGRTDESGATGKTTA